MNTLTPDGANWLTETRQRADIATPTAEVIALRSALDDAEGRVRNGVADDADLTTLHDLAGACDLPRLDSDPDDDGKAARRVADGDVDARDARYSGEPEPADPNATGQPSDHRYGVPATSWPPDAPQNAGATGNVPASQGAHPQLAGPPPGEGNANPGMGSVHGS